MNIEYFKRQVDEYLDATDRGRKLSEKCKDFYDGYQNSEEELAVYKQRNQVPVVINRIKPKVEGLRGLLEMRKTDIKAFPRNKGGDEEAAHAITDALRYVEDNTDFSRVDAHIFGDVVIQGTGAAIVIPKTLKNGEVEIHINRVKWDRFYYDPHSSELDFSDARFKGIMVWMDEDQIEDTFPNADIEAMKIGNGSFSDDETFDDRPRWYTQEKGRRRYRVAQHFFTKKGVWYYTFFSGNEILIKPTVSPYLDEDGEPTCPIVAYSSYIDRENNRYPEVADFLDVQREINARRSKALFFLSARQTKSVRGSIKDVQKLKRELAKPDGHIEIDGEANDFEILNTNDFSQGQLAMYQDGKQEMDAKSVNAQLSGERSSGDLSGKAIEKLQSAGGLEVASIFAEHNSFKKRVFRQVYGSIKQYWDAEKWIRITDDQDNLKWTGLNYAVTVQDYLEDVINDESNELNLRTGASAAYARLMQAQSPVLQEVIEVKNNVAELDVDIILEESHDIINSQQEQFAILAQFAQGRGEISIEDLIELSNLRNKDELIEKIQTRKQEALQAAGGASQMEAETQKVNNAKTFAETQLAQEKAKQMAIENATLVQRPDPTPQVSA